MDPPGRRRARAQQLDAEFRFRLCMFQQLRSCSSRDRAELLDADRRRLSLGPFDRMPASRAIIPLGLELHPDVPATMGAVRFVFPLEYFHRFPLLRILHVSSALAQDIAAKARAPTSVGGPGLEKGCPKPRPPLPASHDNPLLQNRGSLKRLRNFPSVPRLSSISEKDAG